MQRKRFPTSAEMSLDRRPCRFCGEALKHVVVDLGLQPLCQSLVTRDALNTFEKCYPLRAYVCDSCWLVQVHEHVSGEEIFSHYAYFSSYSNTLLEHSRAYVDKMVEMWKLGLDHHVVELASNDGYLLQYFVERAIPCLGVEPAQNVADAAIEKGVPTRVAFFGVETAEQMTHEGLRADLLLANNVLAHVPDLNDFIKGMKILLQPEGVITVEVSHLMRIIEKNLFDTIYQEHYCYYSVMVLQTIFAEHGLTVFHIDELPSQGGSIRVYAQHAEYQGRPVSDCVKRIVDEEHEKGYDGMDVFSQFAQQVAATKRDLLRFLIDAKDRGQSIVGYGAPGKGNTLLNYCGIREDFLDYTVDRNPMKQGTFLVGSRIPVLSPEAISETRPDFILLLPWNLKEELSNQLSYVREWGGKLVVPIPNLEIID